MSSLYILEIKPLSEISLANIFSHVVGSLFILLMFSLAMQKIFILMKSHLFILSFMPLLLGHKGKNLICENIAIFRTFMVLRLIFKSFIHLEFTFVYGVIW